MIRQGPFEQSTPEWVDWKRLRIGASDAATIMGLNPYCSPWELWARKSGLIPEKEIDENMQRGLDLEKEAFNAFTKEIGIPMDRSPRPFISREHDFLIASMDGVNLSKKEGLEIKCGRKSHKMAKKGVIAPYYIPQLAHQCYVCELDVVYYYSYDGEDNVLIPYYRDENFIKKMLKMEIDFFIALVSGEENPPQLRAEEENISHENEDTTGGYLNE